MLILQLFGDEIGLNIRTDRSGFFWDVITTEVNECGCQQEIEQLQSQIILLKNQVDSIVINDGQTKTGVTSTTAHTETS